MSYHIIHIHLFQPMVSKMLVAGSNRGVFGVDAHAGMCGNSVFLWVQSVNVSVYVYRVYMYMSV